MKRNRGSRALRIILWAICGNLFLVALANGVILLRTGDPAANTAKPTGTLAASGWQYEGLYGAYLGTAIAPQFFITAKHVNGSSNVFVLDGVTHNIIEGVSDPYTDLSIWRVEGTFARYAPLYTGADEAGKPLVVIGRGTQRGGETIIQSTVHGWFWGNGDGVKRWGENVVTSIVPGGPVNEYVYATFDQGGVTEEAHLSSGDSGGAVFIKENGVWKLAGISYAVDGPHFFDGNGGGFFFGALFDARDFYFQDSENPPHYTLITGPTPVPTGFYATRISSKRTWIHSVIDPAGDANGNGISNLVDYAQSLNAPEPLGPGSPRVEKEAGGVAFIYRKLNIANPPTYAVQQSSDARIWSTITPSETITEVLGNVRTIKAQIPNAGGPTFLRVQISPPAP